MRGDAVTAAIDLVHGPPCGYEAARKTVRRIAKTTMSMRMILEVREAAPTLRVIIEVVEVALLGAASPQLGPPGPPPTSRTNSGS